MDPSERLLTDLIDAFNCKDVDRAIKALHPEVDWPNLRDQGRIRGIEAVRRQMIDQIAQYDVQIAVITLTPEGAGCIRAHLHYVVRSLAGQLFTEETGTQLFHVRDGLIDRMDLA